VIAFRSGSVPEVVDHGITGFVVSDEEEAIQAIGRLAELDRRRARAQFERRFTSRRMAEEYLNHYAALAPELNAGSSLAEAQDIAAGALNPHLPKRAIGPASIADWLAE
jgi:hypothetical protein